MCALFGIHDPRQPPDPERVRRALLAMQHRGPDGQGQWSDAAQGCALGHGRLALWDLAGGQQPLFNEDRSLVLVMNGELYGHEAQRDALTGQPAVQQAAEAVPGQAAEERGAHAQPGQRPRRVVGSAAWTRVDLAVFCDDQVDQRLAGHRDQRHLGTPQVRRA